MSNIKTILFPTDFTEDAAKAYTYALEVASKTGANLHLLHAVEEPYDFAARVEEAVESRKNEAQEKFDNLLSELQQNDQYNQLDIEFHVTRGKPYSTIRETATDIEADLLVMGTKGESSIKRILYGNVTSDIILGSEIPILTVPVNSKKPYLDRFLFATDYRSKDLQALETTITLAEVFEAELHILHVSEEKNMDEEIRFRGFKDLVKEQFSYEDLHFQHIESERFSKGVAEYLDEYPVSLIVLTRYKKVFLRTLLWANNTQELTYHTHVPMLVLVPEAL